MKTGVVRIWIVLAGLAAACVPPARAWDHATVDTIRTRTVDTAVAAALPGYTYANGTVSGRSLWFYYNAPGRTAGIAALELRITFRDGLPVAPLVNCWQGSAHIVGPITGFVGDEAITYDGSRLQPPTTGNWIEARVGSRSLYLRDNGAPFAALATVARTLADVLPVMPRPTSFEIEASEREEPKQDYLDRDRDMLARVAPALSGDPPRLDVLTPQRSRFSDHDLGFGYREEGRAAGGGYVSVHGQVLLKNGVPEAARISSYYPRAPAPPDLYREWFRPLFGTTDADGSTRLTRYWQYDRAAEAIPAGLFHAALPGAAQFADHPDRAAIAWLMTPFSGTSYHAPREATANRLVWNHLSRLDADICLFMLRSKNPVTRLMAVETLRRNAASWNVDLAILADDFETIYRAVPTIQTQYGDEIRNQDARTLVNGSERG